MLGKILLALILVQGAGNAANGVIRGQIIVPTAHASDRILVLLQKSDGPQVGRIYSDTLGNYEFRGLTAGTYILIVNVEGYEDVRQEIGVAGNGVYGVQIVNIPLREKEKLITFKPDGGAANDIVDLSELGRNYPKKAMQDYGKAVEEMHKGNNVKAMELLKGVVLAAPDFYSAHNALGTLYRKESRFREAETEYRKAHDLNARVADPLVNLGSMFIEEAAARSDEGKNVVGKILDDALDVLEESLKIKRSASAYYFLGTAYYRSSFYEEAEENLKRALDLDGHQAATRLMLANVYMKQQKWASALEHLDAYLRENPKAADREQIEGTRSRVAQRVR
jgi:tetratricopeptide (TPR) repeat protein